MNEGALGGLDGDGGVGGAEAVFEGFFLDGLGEKKVEEDAGCFALVGGAPGGVEDVVGVVVPHVLLWVGNVELAPRRF